MAKTQGRNPMAGRHAVGGTTARPGTPRSGQGARASSGNTPRTGYNPQTSSRPAMRPQAPVLSNQAETSRTAQRMIPRPPMPFENPQGSVNVPAPTHRGFRSTGNPKELNYQKTEVGCANTSLSASEMAAVGYGPNDTKGTWSLISGHATKNNQRQAGKPGKSNQGTSARENSRVRQTGY
jgi:hypothetical protein